MKHAATIFLVALVSQAYTAPQLISFNEGKLGVNFGGYHAGVGLGGLLGGGAGGGLYAEAGTPFGQSAKAGLGGAVGGNGVSTGGLYAGATAGGNIKASAGLSGSATADQSVGGGFANAQAGHHHASSGLGGVAAGGGSTGFSFSGSKSIGGYGGVVKEIDVSQQPEHKKVHTEINVDAANEINPVPLTTSQTGTKTEFRSGFDAQTNIQPSVIVKEVYVQPPPPTIVEKQVYRTHYKPHRHHFRKTAYVHGYLGGNGGVAPPPPGPVVYKTVEPVLEKRIDVGAESAANAGASANAGVHGGGSGEVAFTKQVTFQKNPNFFQDIFNIPISTLKAVSSFLGNTAGSTNVSVQKTASVQADSDLVSSKHAPSSTSSETHVTVQTPPVSKFIDDIFAIPINTLGAVNKFLENNVSARRSVQISQDGAGEPTRVRLGPHGRRRANKVVVVQEGVENGGVEEQ